MHSSFSSAWFCDLDFRPGRIGFADEIRLSAIDLSARRPRDGEPRRRTGLSTETRYRLPAGGSGIGTARTPIPDLRSTLKARPVASGPGLELMTRAANGSVEFRVIGDGKIMWRSGVMRGGQAAKHVDVDLTGVKKLVLQVGDTGDGVDSDHGDWAEAIIVYSGAKPDIQRYHEEAIVLTRSPRLVRG